MKVEPITGRYGTLTLGGRPHRLYWEEAGEGIPLLCLHTAGSDGRQWRAVLNDTEITRHFRVIAYDMPWHGKSSPPEGFVPGEYRLTADGYVAQIVAVAEALGLDRPVVMGCSIGGRVVLHLAHRHPDRFRALIGLQCASHLQPYYDVDWLHRADVHGGEICGAYAWGLCAPGSPEAARWETVWHYMQSGPGVFKGDLHFYKVDGDIRDRLAQIDPTACPIHLLTGEYDYSATPADTRAVAEALGIGMTEMKGLGHFPMSENPEDFLPYLRRVLETVRAVG
jgi:pimeloyl-ACP methyl ester carboxylesterase